MAYFAENVTVAGTFRVTGITFVGNITTAANAGVLFRSRLDQASVTMHEFVNGSAAGGASSLLAVANGGGLPSTTQSVTLLANSGGENTISGLGGAGAPFRIGTRGATNVEIRVNATSADYGLTSGTLAMVFNTSGEAVAYNGIRCDDDTATTGGGASPLNWYSAQDHTSTFTHNGSGGTSGSVVIKVTRVGRLVTLYIPAFACTSGTSSSALSSNTALPSWARPSGTMFGCNQNYDSGGATQTDPLNIQVTTAGVINFYVRNGGNTFINATATNVYGQSITYSV